MLMLYELAFVVLTCTFGVEGVGGVFDGEFDVLRVEPVKPQPLKISNVGMISMLNILCIIL